MKVYCTYCCKEKSKANTAIKAIDLYKSDRIQKLQSLSQGQNVRLVILSGKYGLVDPDQKIKAYDHLLLSHEVEPHAVLVAQQLTEKGIGEMEFFMNSIENDANLKVYLDCIALACKRADVALIVRESEYHD